MEFTFAKTTGNEVAVINGKVYECQIKGTIYKNGKASAKVKITTENGKEVEKVCDLTSIFKNFDAYTKNDNCVGRYDGGRYYIIQDGIKFPFIVNEDENATKVELLVWCWIADPAEGAKRVQVKVTDFEVNPWGYYIQTTQLPAGAKPTKEDVIRAIGVTKVDNEGNESIIGGVVKKLQVTDTQDKVIKMLEKAIQQCEKANIKLIYSQETGRLHAVNGEVQSSITYFDDDERTDYNYAVPVECRKVQCAKGIYYMCDDDVIIAN